jgi:hypothetical protein
MTRKIEENSEKANREWTLMDTNEDFFELISLRIYSRPFVVEIFFFALFSAFSRAGFFFVCFICLLYLALGSMRSFMRTKLLVEEAASKLIELQPDRETTEAFLGKVVAEVVSRKREPSKRPDAMEAAMARGLVARKGLELAEGGSISTDEMAKKMGIQRQAVDHKRKQNQVIAWRDVQGHWRFPRWQLDLKTTKPLKGLDECLGALPDDDWSRMLFFLSRNATLPGQRTPLDLLRAGDVAPVLAAAQRYGRHGD